MDLEKNFDEVMCSRMFLLLKKAGVIFKEKRVIWNLYRDQKAEMRSGVEVGDAKNSKRSKTRMLFIASSLERRLGVKIQGKTIIVIRFVDEIALLGGR